MKRILLLFVMTTVVRAQFYEPKTSAEDPTQRVFPIEAARILAWTRNLDGANVTEIEFVLPASGPGGSTWKIQWKDASGKILRERTVTTTAAQLTGGAEFYRDVFHQVAGDDWTIQSASPDNSSSAFWQGADLAGMSRTEALTTAGKLLAEKPRIERAADAARLAGVLIHGAMPALADRRPLDSLLLARAAAWLCFAETRLREPLNSTWAPVLFLSGRESEATQLWQSPSTRTRLKTGAERFWNLALHETPAQDVFTYAARKENRAWSMPAMFLLARRDPRFCAPLAEIATEGLGPDLLPRCHDYAAALSKSGVPAAEKLIDRTDAVQRGWKSVLAEFHPAPKIGGSRPLMPVATVTAWDILDASENASRPASATEALRADFADEEIRNMAATAIEAARAPNPKSASAPTDVPAFKTADDAWTFIEKLRAPPEMADSPEDGARRIRALLERRRNAADAFTKNFPQDRRHWDAMIFGFEASLHLGRMGGRENNFVEERKKLEEVLDAPDASEDVKANAEFLLITLTGFSVMEPHTLPPLQRRITGFLEKHPNHPHAEEIAQMQMQLLEIPGSQGAEQLLANLAALPNARIAERAKAMIETRTRFLQLKKKPLDLKFTAADGSEVDLGKMRGQVVLLDFWASWCGPCMAEAPHVVQTYEKFRSRGFTVAGISLDQDRAAMEGAVKKIGMTWPQFFDGAGWQNRIAQQFGIRSIPSAWLFDKKGLLRETDLRGDSLAAAIERLLAE